jgi:hypothetical protein
MIGGWFFLASWLAGVVGLFGAALVCVGLVLRLCGPVDRHAPGGLGSRAYLWAGAALGLPVLALLALASFG